MYYRSFFCKENAFNAVFFLAILVFAIVKFIFFPDELVHISFTLSILITVLSVIDLTVKSLERIIYDQDKKIRDEFEYLTNRYSENEISSSFYSISSMNEKEFIDYLNNTKEMIKNEYRFEYDIELLKIYWEIIQVRNKIRIVRRILLLFYYLVLLCIIILLMFSSNLSEFLKDIKHPDMTIWSFIIILFDVLLSQPINASIYNALSKYYNKKTKTLNAKKLE